MGHLSTWYVSHFCTGTTVERPSFDYIAVLYSEISSPTDTFLLAASLSHLNFGKKGKYISSVACLLATASFLTSLLRKDIIGGND